MHITRLDSTQADFSAQLEGVTALQDELDQDVTATVAAIIADVRASGDEAVLKYTARFDRLEAPSMASLEEPKSRLQQALEAIDPEQRGV